MPQASFKSGSIATKLFRISQTIRRKAPTREFRSFHAPPLFVPWPNPPALKSKLAGPTALVSITTLNVFAAAQSTNAMNH